MVIIDQESYHCQQRKNCIYYLDAGHPLDRALLLLLRRPLPALNLDYNHDGDDEDDNDDHDDDDDHDDYDGDGDENYNDDDGDGDDNNNDDAPG